MNDATNRKWVLVATILGAAMAFIDGTVVNVALPALQREFQASVADVQWVAESYLLFVSALLLVGGSLGDIYGRRRVYAVGVTTFALASAACAAAPTIGTLIACRAVQGIGAALLIPGNLAILSATFPPAERGAAIGAWSGWSAISTAIGPLLGGWTIDHLSWRWAFVINVPMAAVVLFLVWRFMGESRGEEARVDVLGAVLATTGLGGIVYGLIESSSSGPQWSAIASGVALLVFFIIVEFRVGHPMLEPALFRSRNFSGANLLTVLLYGALGAVFFFVPLDMIQIHHYSATAAGAASLPFVVFMFSLSRWAGGLVDRFGARLPLVVGPGLTAASFLLYGRVGSGGSYWTTFFPAIVAAGLGMTITVAPLSTTVMNAVDAAHAGIASGINNAASRLAGLLAIAILGLFMQGVFNRSLHERLASLGLAPSVQMQIEDQRDRLADIAVPSTLPLARRAVDEAFVDGYRYVCWLMCGMAAASALAAGIIIRD